MVSRGAYIRGACMRRELILGNLRHPPNKATYFISKISHPVTNLNEVSWNLALSRKDLKSDLAHSSHRPTPHIGGYLDDTLFK